ncbi:MAG: hypothetical protein GY869_13670, partial [Planctomycetes bacterium]|nr:hypothetical protein [Planctomycetota bacterium]
VQQTAYSFSRSYAEDFIIFDFSIINTSTVPLDSVWVGYIADFKVDFDAHDLIRIINSDGNTSGRKDLIYLWDSDPDNGNWDPTGHIGFLILKTPGNRGITDFHYFDNIYEPATNEQLWEVMSSDTTGTHITPANFFHGDNYRIDDDALAPGMDPSGDGLGTDFVFIVSTGPIDLAVADTIHSAFAVVMGQDENEMSANVEMIKSMAERNYLGPNAPPSPSVQAFPGDKRVTVTWDGQASEIAADILSGRLDFEGFRIYRSEDEGQTWGDPITDDRGIRIGYVPTAQFDLDNNVSGTDPNSNFYLGDNSGLRHTFIDSTVLNGIDYWYTVTAYDRGDIETSVPALESSRGVTTDEPNVVSVIPTAPFSDYIPPQIDAGDSLPPLPSGSACDSRLAVEIIDYSQLSGDSYRVTFNDIGFVIAATEETTADTTVTTTFNLLDLTTGETMLSNHPLLDETGDNVPVTDGFRVLAREVEAGATFLGWTHLAGETPTYEWRVTNFEAVQNSPRVGPDGVYSSDD